MDVREAFNAVADHYDAGRRKIIPCFDDFYGLPIRSLDYAGESPRVLDLGAGTGLFSALLLTKYPKARLTLTDISEKMLDAARRRFEGRPDFVYVRSDFNELEAEGPFDIIISAIAIHHLPGPDKKHLYGKCHRWLAPGGTFVNADMIKEDSPELDAWDKAQWMDRIVEGGMSREEVGRVFVCGQYDQPSTISEQLLWLREAGFSDACIIYKWLPLAVFLGHKRSNSLCHQDA